MKKIDLLENKRNLFIIIAAAVALILVGVIIFLSVSVVTQKQAAIEANNLAQQLQIDNDNLRMSTELAELNAQFQQHENEAIKLENDSILAKYNDAKSRVEELVRQLNEQKIKDKAEMDKLRNEISSLRGILRHYISMVDSLSRENAALRTENAEVRGENKILSSKVDEVSRENEQLSERMILAEKLNVTGVTLTPLNKKGKTEKKVTKAKQMMVTFTIPQNNSTPVGPKTIYLRLTGPEGTLLGNGGTFSFEGQSIQCTAKKTIEYAGEEIAGITIYWDVNATLNPGEYTVELFADNYRLTSRKFTLKK